jgi:hypothetical protein
MKRSPRKVTNLLQATRIDEKGNGVGEEGPLFNFLQTPP